MSDIHIDKKKVHLRFMELYFCFFYSKIRNLSFWNSLFFGAVLIVFLLSPIVTQAQIILSDPAGELDKPSLDSMYQQALIVAANKRNAHVDFQYCNILSIDNVWHMIPDGHFDVYVWKDEKWQNTYRKDDLGYNFFSTKYIYRNRIHSYGGYGFWRLNSEIISFNPNLSEWFISKGYKDIPEGVCIPGHDLLLIIKGNELSTLDLNSGEINTCIADIVSQFQLRTPVFTLIGKNYTVFLEENLQLLLEKPGNSIYTLKVGALKNVHLTKKEDCIHVKEDSIFIYDSELKENFRESLRANFDQYVPVECAKVNSLTSFWKSITLIIVLLGAILAVIFLKAKKSGRKEDNVSLPDGSDDSSLFDKIIKTAGSTITQEDLDLIFGIPGDISPETKRFRRATLITEINNKSKLLLSKEIIIRIKDPMDKRKYLYYIEL